MQSLVLADIFLNGMSFCVWDKTAFILVGLSHEELEVYFIL